MRKVGKFTRVLRKNGTILLKPYFKDSIFLSDIRHLFHAEFGTEFAIRRIIKCSQGFHVQFSEVSSWRQAEYFVGEEFALPEVEVEGRSIDLLLGMDVYRGDRCVGKAMGFTPTPDYFLLSIRGEDEVIVPFTEHFVVVEKDRINLLRDF